MKKYTTKIIAGIVIAIILALAFFCGGKAPSTEKTASPQNEAVNIKQSSTPTAEEKTEEKEGDFI